MRRTRATASPSSGIMFPVLHGLPANRQNGRLNKSSPQLLPTLQRPFPHGMLTLRMLLSKTLSKSPSLPINQRSRSTNSVQAAVYRKASTLRFIRRACCPVLPVRIHQPHQIEKLPPWPKPREQNSRMLFLILFRQLLEIGRRPLNSPTGSKKPKRPLHRKFPVSVNSARRSKKMLRRSPNDRWQN